MAMSSPIPSSRRQFSARSSARFFHLLDAIGRLHEPTATQLGALESSYKSTAEFLSGCNEFKGLLEEIHPHGSREIGTLVRPLDPNREGFDIDLIARLKQQAMRKYNGTGGPTDLLDDLHNALSRYASAHNLKLTRWERCVTLEYAGGMTADIAPIIDHPSFAGVYGDSCAMIPDRRLRFYDITNPRGYAKLFGNAASISPHFTSALIFNKAHALDSAAKIVPLSDVDEVFPRLLSRFVQVLKLHRNVSFGRPSTTTDLAPKSVFLTSLAATAYSELAPTPHASPLDLLLSIIAALPRYFEVQTLSNGSELWILDNPSAPGENLASGMNTSAKQQAFRQWQTKAQQDIEFILVAIDESLGMDTLLARVEHAFGARAARAIRDEQAQNLASNRSAGRSTILTATGALMPTIAKSHTFFGG